MDYPIYHKDILFNPNGGIVAFKECTRKVARLGNIIVECPNYSSTQNNHFGVMMIGKGIISHVWIQIWKYWSAVIGYHLIFNLESFFPEGDRELCILLYVLVISACLKTVRTENCFEFTSLTMNLFRTSCSNFFQIRIQTRLVLPDCPTARREMSKWK